MKKCWFTRSPAIFSKSVTISAAPRNRGSKWCCPICRANSSGQWPASLVTVKSLGFWYRLKSGKNTAQFPPESPKMLKKLSKKNTSCFLNPKQNSKIFEETTLAFWFFDVTDFQCPSNINRKRFKLLKKNHLQQTGRVPSSQITPVFKKKWSSDLASPSSKKITQLHLEKSATSGRMMFQKELC